MIEQGERAFARFERGKFMNSVRMEEFCGVVMVSEVLSSFNGDERLFIRNAEGEKHRLGDYRGTRGSVVGPESVSVLVSPYHAQKSIRKGSCEFQTFEDAPETAADEHVRYGVRGKIVDVGSCDGKTDSLAARGSFSTAVTQKPSEESSLERNPNPLPASITVLPSGR